MLYAPLAPRCSGLLPVGGGHAIYWEDSGNINGTPVVVLHGGPGAGCTDVSRRWFDPRRYRIVTFDQRGCGRSTPHASIADNTAAHLVGDLETLRQAMHVERWILFGRSWGAALAIAYAARYPEAVTRVVLNAVFTASPSELAWLYGGGAAHLAPKAWARFAGRVRPPHNLLDGYHRQLTSGDALLEAAAAQAWCEWEDTLAAREGGPVPPDPRAALARARIGAHYLRNEAVFADGDLLQLARQLGGIRALIIHGAFDAVTPLAAAQDLHLMWPGSELRVVPEGRHVSTEPTMMRALVDAFDDLDVGPIVRSSATDSRHPRGIYCSAG